MFPSATFEGLCESACRDTGTGCKVISIYFHQIFLKTLGIVLVAASSRNYFKFEISKQPYHFAHARRVIYTGLLTESCSLGIRAHTTNLLCATKRSRIRTALTCGITTQMTASI